MLRQIPLFKQLKHRLKSKCEMWAFVSWLLWNQCTKHSSVRLWVLLWMTGRDYTQESAGERHQRLQLSSLQLGFLDLQSKAEAQSNCQQKRNHCTRELLKILQLFSPQSGGTVCGLESYSDSLKLLYQFWVYIYKHIYLLCGVLSYLEEQEFKTVEACWQNGVCKESISLDISSLHNLCSVALWVLIKDNASACFWCEYTS